MAAQLPCRLCPPPEPTLMPWDLESHYRNQHGIAREDAFARVANQQRVAERRAQPGAES